MSRRELLKGSTETLLLSLVAGEPMYGYQLVKEMEQKSSGYFRFKEGTLYPALHRLEAEGLIASDWRPASNGQLRRYYQITQAGVNRLGSLQHEWRQFARAVDLVVQTPG
ncbi:MAG: PadR family transcriptional regulator [SAR202 cluster bacterium]|nr:PadR family transcriptional regulator [SAR202 cluster bacterium]